jgi:hypothetical protein
MMKKAVKHFRTLTAHKHIFPKHSSKYADLEPRMFLPHQFYTYEISQEDLKKKKSVIPRAFKAAYISKLFMDAKGNPSLLQGSYYHVHCRENEIYLYAEINVRCIITET